MSAQAAQTSFLSFTTMDQNSSLPSFVIPGRSARQTAQAEPLDVTVAEVKRLRDDAFARYVDAYKGGHETVASYWDGYIRAIEHVIEMRHE